MEIAGVVDSGNPKARAVAALLDREDAHQGFEACEAGAPEAEQEAGADGVAGGGAEGGPLERPFELVSAVPGSSPPRRPWHTPVWVVSDSSDARAAMNAALTKAVLALRDDDPEGARVSNIGAWQSRRELNLLLEGGGLPGEAGAAVRQLHVHILEQIDEFVAELRLPSRGTGGEELLPFVTIRDSWANINPRGR